LQKLPYQKFAFLLSQTWY